MNGMSVVIKTMSAALIAAVTVSGSVSHAGQAPAATPQAVPQPARLPDGKPNWTGFWTPATGLMERNFGPGADQGRPAGPPPAGGANTGAQPAAQMPAIKSPYKESYEAIVKERAAGIITDDPSARCIPLGMPRMMGMIYGMEFLQTPRQVTITSDFGGAQRRIYTDGRPLPNMDEMLPTYSGHSVGRWEGDVLVVDTIGTREDVPLTQAGLPHSGNLRISERFYSNEPGFLMIDQTLTDPDVFTDVWKTTRRFRFRPDLALVEFVCAENNRNVGPGGVPDFK